MSIAQFPSVRFVGGPLAGAVARVDAPVRLVGVTMAPPHDIVCRVSITPPGCLPVLSQLSAVPLGWYERDPLDAQRFEWLGEVTAIDPQHPQMVRCGLPPRPG